MESFSVVTIDHAAMALFETHALIEIDFAS